VDESRKQELRRKLATDVYMNRAIDVVAEDLIFGRKSLIPSEKIIKEMGNHAAQGLDRPPNKTSAEEIARTSKYYYENRDRLRQKAREKYAMLKLVK